MADVQLENGFTRIANPILDSLAKLPLNGTQWRILIVVFRYTYGFHRKDYELSEAFISKQTGIHRKQIGRELSSLIENNIITVEKEATFTTSRALSFNKNYESWKLSTKTLTPNENKTPNELVELTGIELVDQTGIGLVDHININIKKNLKKEIDEFFESIWKLYPEKKGKAQVRDKQKEKLYNIGFEQIKKCIDRYRASKPDWKAWQHGSTFFNSGYIDYMDGNYEVPEAPKYMDVKR